MDRPRFLGEQLPGLLVAGVRVPELRREDEAAKGLGAARVGQAGDGVGGAGEDGVVCGVVVRMDLGELGVEGEGRTQLAGVVQAARVVERSRSCAAEQQGRGGGREQLHFHGQPMP